jgi:hypothetical protein
MRDLMMIVSRVTLLVLDATRNKRETVGPNARVRRAPTTVTKRQKAQQG